MTMRAEAAGNLPASSPAERLSAFEERYRNARKAKRVWTAIYGALFIAA